MHDRSRPNLRTMGERERYETKLKEDVVSQHTIDPRRPISKFDSFRLKCETDNNRPS